MQFVCGVDPIEHGPDFAKTLRDATTLLTVIQATKGIRTAVQVQKKPGGPFQARR